MGLDWFIFKISFKTKYFQNLGFCLFFTSFTLFAEPENVDRFKKKNNGFLHYDINQLLITLVYSFFNFFMLNKIYEDLGFLTDF